MKTFVFLVTFWAQGADDQTMVYVEDYDLSGADCIALVESYRGEGVPSCELDTGVHHDDLGAGH